MQPTSGGTAQTPSIFDQLNTFLSSSTPFSSATTTATSSPNLQVTIENASWLTPISPTSTNNSTPASTTYILQSSNGQTFVSPDLRGGNSAQEVSVVQQSGFQAILGTLKSILLRLLDILNPKTL